MASVKKDVKSKGLSKMAASDGIGWWQKFYNKFTWIVVIKILQSAFPSHSALAATINFTLFHTGHFE